MLEVADKTADIERFKREVSPASLPGHLAIGHIILCFCVLSAVQLETARMEALAASDTLTANIRLRAEVRKLCRVK